MSPSREPTRTVLVRIGIAEDQDVSPLLIAAGVKYPLRGCEQAIVPLMIASPDRVTLPIGWMWIGMNSRTWMLIVDGTPMIPTMIR
jgi:hypothetical protein